MEKLPKNFKTEDYLNKLVSVSGFSEDNMYKWGRNCRILHKDDLNIAKNIIQKVEGLTSEQYDAFWEGYFYGIEQII